MNKTTILLVLLTIVCFTVAACTATQAASASAAVATGVGAILKSIEPALSAEQVANLQVIASRVDGTVEATAKAIGMIADTIASLRAHAETQVHAVADAASALSVKVGALPTTGDVVAISGTTGVGTASASAAVLNAHRNKTRATALRHAA